MKAQSSLRYFPSPRILLETTLVRICRPIDEHTIEALEARIALLEQNGVNGAILAPASVTEKPQASATQKLPPWEEAPLASAVSAPIDGGLKNKQGQTASNPVQEKQVSDPDSNGEKPSHQENGTSGDHTAEQLWKAVLNRIKVKNPMVYYLAKEGTGVAWNGEVLTVAFSSGSESKRKMCDATVNRTVIVSCLNEEHEGASVLFCEERLDEKEQRVKELFGNVLSFQEE